MKRSMAIAIFTIVCASCATQQTLVLPPLPGAPGNWPAFSTVTIAGSECPRIEGAYLDPPSIHREGADQQFLPKDDKRLFVGPVPFQLANESELPPETKGVPREGFLILQSAASGFDFLYFNYQATAVLKFHFQSNEGDFECHHGYIEFPRLTEHGMIEGRSMNFQVRNVLYMDESGALVIQSTRGPYRGHKSQMEAEASYEFFRYARQESTTKD